ncbi:MAG TPA: ATP-dependent DNA helicase RecG [Candidatus Paceibacterota bacterium]
MLNSPISEIRGVGLKFLPKLKKLGIETAEDLLRHFPTRYEDWSTFSSIEKLNPGDEKTISGEVTKINVRRAWRKKTLLVEASIQNGDKTIRAIWFNQPYIKNILKIGTKANFAGKVVLRDKKIYLQNPAYEVINGGESKHTGRIIPIYSETKGLTSKGIRYLISILLEETEKIEEFMPGDILEKYNLPEINKGINDIHFPKNKKAAEIAQKRFAFEELFLLQIKNAKHKLALKNNTAPKIIWTNKELQTILEKLPFTLTNSQKESLIEILKDLSSGSPMNRILQGDVGSGKTIVAGLATIITAKQDYQIAIMAPTEILARQHYKTLIKFFADYNIPIGLLLSKETRIFYEDGLEAEPKKESFKNSVREGIIKIVIGTHALIQKGIEFKNLALVIIDEQHRFGVEQRKKLLANKKGDVVSHFLSMSATPIPRTLMMTIFGDLDVSQISENPKGRKEIITKIVDPINRDKAYAFIRGQVRRGRQVFVVCPRITSRNGETDNKIVDPKERLLWEVKAVEDEHEKLKNRIFPDLKVSMLHGKMKGAEKEKTMRAFSEKKSDILVSTSVIEVGIDVPNATIMMIEGADRFGLAQLYQLRGRVGRGEHQSFCFLFTESHSEQTHARLKSIAEAKNGLELAKIDLALRGPGELLGKDQAGMPDIAMSSLQNPRLIKETRDAAIDLLKHDPEFEKHQKLIKKIEIFEEKIHLE